MADLINNLKYKSYEQLEEALFELSTDNNNNKAFIDINGNAYLIPKEVYDVIDNLASQVEKLKDEVNGL
tara:strand:- start:629 stop:835 length:207 start_codon:yes stop_codon:yes gene_type:complete